MEYVITTGVSIRGFATALALAVGLTGLLACDKEPEEKFDPAAKAEAEKIFQQRCVTCHGEKGQGNGPGSAALTPKPRNFLDPTWQRMTKDEHIEKIIVGGGAAVGKSPAMPGNPDLASKPEVVKALRAHIRQLKP